MLSYNVGYFSEVNASVMAAVAYLAVLANLNSH